LNADFGWLL